MCGLLGLAGGAVIGSDEWFENGLNVLSHRGPDDHGMWSAPTGDVRLGHRRLSIIDLSATGHQPLCDVNGRAWIVFNGEIYNHTDLRRELRSLGYKFRSSSDTEVLVNGYLHWGEQLVERLIGMFAFAIYDSERHKVFLARDRAGEKPLFYRHEPGSLWFASELKALFKDPATPRKLHSSAVHHYLAFGTTPTDHSMITGIRKLPPAHCLSFDISSGTAKRWQYWHLPQLDPEACGKENRIEALSEEFESLFEDAVKRQLVADVPVGVLLSGGVDSSLVTALAARHSADVRTYCLSQPGAPERDETAHARLIAEYFGTRHTELVVDDPDPGIIDKLAWQYDDPIADSSMIPTYLISEAVRKHCTVAVGGDAGDELFGGYKRYNHELRMQQRMGWLSGIPIDGIANVLRRLVPIGARGSGHLRQLSAGFSLGGFPPTYLFIPDERKCSPKSAGGQTRTVEADRAKRLNKFQTPGLDAMLRADFSSYLPDDLLVKVDRASMLVSLEVRSPLLDHRVVEFAFSRVPDLLKANRNERKIFLKHMAKRLLPPEFDQRRKQGFSVPVRQWLRNPVWQEYFASVLFDRPCDLVDSSQVDRIWKAAKSGRNVSPQLFALVMLQRWRQIYGVSV